MDQVVDHSRVAEVPHVAGEVDRSKADQLMSWFVSKREGMPAYGARRRGLGRRPTPIKARMNRPI